MTDLPLIIDCFAGGGGASTGIERALGRSPDVAINHSGPALALHEANHPETLHLNSNIWDVEPASVAAGRKIGLLWASPDCKHFSKAKGGAPKDRNIRDLAWAVVKWARLPKAQRPDVILLENVEEFRTWGPICDDGQPIRGLEGTTFELWMRELRDLGYKCDWKELRGCDYGAPTIRKRFFMVARCDGRKIVWPAATHGDPNSKEVKRGKLKPWRTAAECVDFSLPCPSIFDSAAEIKEKHDLRAVRPLAHNTLARIARGMQRYVLQSETPFLVNLTHGGRVEGIDDPFKTITGARRGEKALITPYVTKFNTGATGSPIDAPAPTVTANSWQKRPGGAAPLGLITPHLMTMRNAQKPFSAANEPTHTITAGGAGLTLVAPMLASLKGTARRMSAMDAPHPTVLAGGGHSAMIAPILTYAQHGGQNRDPLDPMHTITASRKDNNSLLTAFLAQHNKARVGVNPGRAINAPLSTATATGSQQSLIAPLLAQTGYGEREGQAPRALDLHRPLGTVVAGGIKHATFAPFFASYYGTGEGARTDAPCRTITTKDRFSHVQAEVSAPPFTEDHEDKARQVADFLRAHGAWDGGEFVTLTIGGAEYVIVDIGMRMLTPRELFNAQGFPPDYVIDGVWTYDSTDDEWTFTAFPKHVQVSCCGNSVCPDLAEALARANCQHLIQTASAAA